MSVPLMMDIPDELAEALRSAGRDLPRAALESLAIEAYRSSRLSDVQLRRLLGLNRWQADALLKEHGVWLDYTIEDFNREGEGTRPVLKQRPR